MDEENQNQTEQQDEVEQFVIKQTKNASRNIANQGLKLLKKAGAAVAKLISTFVMTNFWPIFIGIAVVHVLSLLFPAVENWMDKNNAQTIDEVTYKMVKEYCTIDGTGVHFDKEKFLENIVIELDENQVDLVDLGFGDVGSETASGNTIDTNSEAAQYLYKFVSASLAGEFPYIPGSDPETQGIIKIKRKTNDTQEAKDLTYMGYTEFSEKLKTTDNAIKDDLINYFSIDENWNLCIVKPYKRTENHYSNGVLTSSSSEYTISEIKIPYRTMTAQYTVPFLFLIDLQLITHNPDYVEAVADLVKKQSEIEFTIFDEITTDDYEYTYTATRYTKRLEYPTDSNGNPILNVDKVPRLYVSEVKDKTTIFTQTDKIKANITKAKTWIIEQETNYEMQTKKEYPYSESGQEKTTVGSSSYETEGEGTWDNPIHERWYEEIIINEWVKSGNTNTKILPDKFMGLWSNETGTYVEGATYLPVGDGKPGKIVKYNIRGSSTTDEPIINIVTSQEKLYTLLEKSVTTQIHAEFMREMIKIYEGSKELNEGTFSASAFKSMYEPDEFVEGSYVGDFDVHDESLFVTDLEQLKKAFEGGYSTNAKLIANAQVFLDMQEKYKVNAIFAAAVSVTETSAGTKGNGSNGRNNWFNITGTDGPYETTTDKHGNKYNWRVYESDSKGIEAFGIFISGEGATKRYYPEGNYTVRTIGEIYCPNSRDYPTQAEDWVSTTLSQMTRFYEAIGIDITPMITGQGFAGAGGEGYRGIYTTADGKSYVEYLQGKGPWASKWFCGGTMANSGCSITSVATILSGFGIDVNPEDLRARFPNSTSMQSLIQSYGISCTKDTNATSQEVLEHLRKGNPVIVYTDPPAENYWTKNKHFFPVLEAVGDKGYVANPTDNAKTGLTDMDVILQDNVSVLLIGG